MKIGILTQPLRNNYGGLLQNYALQTVLKRLGHEATTIDWDGRFTLKERLWRIRIQLMHLINKSSNIKLKYIPTKKEDLYISVNTNRFVEKYINHTLAAYTQSSLQRNALKLNAQAFVVGSDQVWRPGYNSFQYAMFLDFTQDLNIRRIAYAASFGTSKWGFGKEETERIKQLVNKFDVVTVRERSGVDLCKKYMEIDSFHVLDPTMLLNRDDYEKLVFEENEPESKGTLFHYILDPNAEKTKFIEDVSKRKGLNPFTVMPKYQAENRTKESVKHHIDDCVFPSVTSWLRSFMDAKMVIVDSFHGAVFSIIFNKPFWVIGNKGRGNARFESLLSLFNLNNRFVDDPGSIDIDIDSSIDWDAVNAIRIKEIEKSLYLLNKGLNK